MFSSQNLGSSTSPSIWPVLSHLWVLTSVAHHQGPNLYPELRSLHMDFCASLAKFTRNLVAGNAANQIKALFVSPLSFRIFLPNLTKALM